MNVIPRFKFCLDEDLGDKIIEFKSKLKVEDFLPTRAYDTDTGWDVRCAKTIYHIDIAEESYTNPAGFKFIKIPLGLKVLAPEGWWLNLHPRSSTFIKKYLIGLVGVIDQTYEGSLYFCCKVPEGIIFNSKEVVNFGDKIGQLIPVKRQEMIVESPSQEEFERLCKERNAARKDGGLGSTGD
jgi:dUTPase